MKKASFLSLILSLAMVLSPMSAFGVDDISIEEPIDEEISIELEEQIAETEGLEQSESNTSKAANADPIDYSTWSSDDFTYEYKSKLLYGCDYTRQIYINGMVITGFSEHGLDKLDPVTDPDSGEIIAANGNTDLIIPSKTPDGETITGVGESAFNGMHLTSVTFPKGMLVSYDDTITHSVSRRGNFIIHESAFANNDLTEVVLPAGVIACMANSFQKNQIAKVTLPRTIWWIETLAFARNRITQVNFPQTCDFRMEMHGMSFASNRITSVRLPDYTEVVNKDVFAMNPGMEPMTEEIAKKRSETDYEKYLPGGSAESGIVYMYTDNEGLFDKQRIHTIDRPTKNQWSPFQKLILISSSSPDADTEKWNTNDFTYNDRTITGLSPSGKIKRKKFSQLVIPDRNPDGNLVREIADSDNPYGGLFGEKIIDGAGEEVVEGFDTVVLPNNMITIGSFAFAGMGLKEVVFSSNLAEIGAQAFANNELENVIIPDNVTMIGQGAFADNPTIRRITIPHNTQYKVIEEETFGCSDADSRMTDLKEIEIPDTITAIEEKAFAGNNFAEIEIPSSVKQIGSNAFSDSICSDAPTTLILNEGIETIANKAFRNKRIEKVVVPVTLQALPGDAFEKNISGTDAGGDSLKTKVYVKTEEQYDDKTAFPDSDYQKIYLSNPEKWTPGDFEFDEIQSGGETLYGITGLSEEGKDKLGFNNDLNLLAADEDGRAVEAIAPNAFDALRNNSESGISDIDVRIASVEIPNHSVRIIGSSAFRGNDLTKIEIPEGVEVIGGSAFESNKLKKVTLPVSIRTISERAFANNTINLLEFAEGGSSQLEICAEAFADNKFTSFIVSDNLDILSGTAFSGNPGVTTDAGVVYIYKPTESGSALEYKSNGKSICQEMQFGEVPAEMAPWGPRHFSFSGSTITGFSTDGVAKLKADPYVILPGKSADGTVVTTVGERAFYDYGGYMGEDDPDRNPALRGVEFAPSITTIKQAAFQMCAIEDLTLPNTIKVLEPSAFSSNYGMKTITLSEGLTDIPDGVFITNAVTDLNAGVHDLVIPEGVTRIGARAFTGQHVRNLTLPDTLVEIDEYAFQNHQIENLEIPSSVKKIGYRAFEVRQDGAEPLPSHLTLHEGLEEIDAEAFGQTSLDYVIIPSSLASIDERAFVDWRGNGRADSKPVYLRTNSNEQAEAAGDYAGISVTGAGHKVVFDNMVGTGWEYDDFTYSEDGTAVTGWSEKGNAIRKIYAGLPSYPDMRMPDTPSYDSDTQITEIADNAFQLELKNEDGTRGEVTMRKFDCDSPYGIQRLVFPANLEKIGANAFEYNNLQTLDLEAAESLRTIGVSAFHGNHLSTVVIPDRITDLGEGAFAMNNIINLTLPSGITRIPQGCFSMNIFMSEVEIPDTVIEIDDMAFAGARLENLDIPASVTRIGRRAFHLHHLSTLHIPGNVKVIDESAFEGTFKESTLTRLILDEGIESIGKYAFKEALLEEVILPNSLREMGESPFYSNKGKDGSRVVELYTGNPMHLKFNNDEYQSVESGRPVHYHNVQLKEELVTPEVTEDAIEEAEKAAETIEPELNDIDKQAQDIVKKAETVADDSLAEEIRDAISSASEALDTAKNAEELARYAKMAAEAAVNKAETDEEKSAAADQLARADAVNSAAKTTVAKASISVSIARKASAKVASNKAAAAKTAAAKAAATPGDAAIAAAVASETAAKEAADKASDALESAKDAESAALAALESAMTDEARAEAQKRADDAAQAVKDAEKAKTGADVALTEAKKAVSAAKTAKASAEAARKQAAAIADGTVHSVGGSRYKVLSSTAGDVTLIKARNSKTVTIPATVKLYGKAFKVTQVNAKAFTGKKIRTVTIGKNVKRISKNAFKSSKATRMIIKTRLLKKATVKGSLKSSNIKTVQVKIGKKKANKTYIKKYKKIFTKKNAGRKVKIK